MMKNGGQFGRQGCRKLKMKIIVTYATQEIHYLKLAERGKSDFLHMNGYVFDNRNMNNHSEDKEEQLRE